MGQRASTHSNMNATTSSPAATATTSTSASMSWSTVQPSSDLPAAAPMWLSDTIRRLAANDPTLVDLQIGSRSRHSRQFQTDNNANTDNNSNSNSNSNDVVVVNQHVIALADAMRKNQHQCSKKKNHNQGSLSSPSSMACSCSPSTSCTRNDNVATIRRLQFSHLPELSQEAALSLIPALKNQSALETIEVEECGCDVREENTEQNEGQEQLYVQPNSSAATTTGHTLLNALSVALAMTPYNKLQRLRTLRISATCTTEASAKSLAFLVHAACDLHHLQIVHNQLEDPTTTNVQACYALGSAIRTHSSLKTVDLTGNGLTDAGIQALTEGFMSPASSSSTLCLEFLSLDFNSFGDMGMRAIAENVLQNPQCQVYELNLFGNSISAVGASFLAQALTGTTTVNGIDNNVKVKANSSLKALTLSFNQIGDVGAAALAEALTVNRTLTQLRIPSNNLSSTGMYEFARRLPYMKGLQELNIGLVLDDVAAQALVDAVEDNHHLIVLDMEKPMYEEDFESQEEEQLFYNERDLLVHYSDADDDDDDDEALVSLQATTTTEDDNNSNESSSMPDGWVSSLSGHHPQHSTPCPSQGDPKLDFFLRLNRAGRQWLHEEHIYPGTRKVTATQKQAAQHLHPGLWAHILANTNRHQYVRPLRPVYSSLSTWSSTLSSSSSLPSSTATSGMASPHNTSSSCRVVKQQRPRKIAFAPIPDVLYHLLREKPDLLDRNSRVA